MMKKLLLAVALAFVLFGPKPAYADSLTWDAGVFGTLQIPTWQAISPMGGYDLITKQSLGGVQAPFWQLVKMSDGSKLIDILDLGAVGVSGSATFVQPYVGMSFNIHQFQAGEAGPMFKIGVGGRWASDSGKIGCVVTGAVTFGGV